MVTVVPHHAKNRAVWSPGKSPRYLTSCLRRITRYDLSQAQVQLVFRQENFKGSKTP